MGLLITLHPTQFCNLDCSYCWAPERNNPAKMSLDTLETVLRQVATRDAFPVEVLWLTGEPLVLGLDYFKQAIGMCNDFLAGAGARRFVIQTNGTLIDEAYADFFAEAGVTVGVSIDGPAVVHDRQRRDRRGQPTHRRALTGIELLAAKGVRGGALCVLTRNTLELSPDELFHFFHDRGIAWSYLIEAKIGENCGSQDALALADIPRLRTFLGRLIDLWGAHPGSYIRDFDQLSRRLFGSEREYSLDNLGCLDILNVLPNGDFFWGNPELMAASTAGLAHIRSNLARSSVWEFKETDAYTQLQVDTHKGVEKCKAECDLFVSCRGGNPAHKYYTTGGFDASEHLTCQLNDKVIAPLLVERLRTSLEAA